MTKEISSRLQGTVRQYKGNGRRLGYPTANISTQTSLDDGIYFGFAELGSYVRQPALIFVGTPVTVGDTERRVEAHLIDIIDTDYYGQDITLDVQHFHRANQKFDSTDELLAAMKSDETVARAWFAKKA
jgi:FAD synthase